MEEHKEKIICPKCGTKQIAIVKHTMPFHTYLHECKLCAYIIQESEWENAPEHQAT